MRDFWKTLVRRLEGGCPACLVSLLAADGSTPRGAGALLAVFPDGSAVGTIGGGSVEWEAQRLAEEVLETGRDAIREYRFIQGEENSLGMVCGGDVTVHFQYLAAGEASAGPFRAVLDADMQGRDAWLVRRLEGEQVTATGVADREGVQFLSQAPPEGLLTHRPLLTEGDPRWFSIPAARAGRVHLFGGGHVSRALTNVLAPLGFRCTVYDDRPEFADPDRFPGAERTALCDFNSLDACITDDDYVVVITRGHQADYEVLCQVLRSGARYIGCIGSRRKLALCREGLLRAGFTGEEYSRLHAPIGLPIGADTPEEIAVSVAAELIAARSGTLANFEKTV